MAHAVIDIEYEQPDTAEPGGDHNAVCTTRHAWARVPPEPSRTEREALKGRIRHLLRERHAVMVSHFYVHPDLQDLAEETGGLVSDSLEMARFGRDHAARTLVVSGVRFMGETAKILSPEKTRCIVPELDGHLLAGPGLPGRPMPSAAFCDQHPDRTVVVYANTSAAVKARADWMVTSGLRPGRSGEPPEGRRARKFCGHRTAIWAITSSRETGADMLSVERQRASCTTSSRRFELELAHEGRTP